MIKSILSYFKLRPVGLFIFRLFILIAPAALAFTLLRSNPAIQQWVSVSFPVYHLAYLVMHSSSWLLSMAGFENELLFTSEVYRYPVFLMKLIGGSSIFIGYSCLGIGVMWFFSAVILASKGRGKIKAAYILIGIFIIQLLNILRMSYLAWLLRDNPNSSLKEYSFFDSIRFDHHDAFNILIYIIVFIMIILWFENKQLIHLKANSK